MCEGERKKSSPRPLASLPLQAARSKASASACSALPPPFHLLPFLFQLGQGPSVGKKPQAGWKRGDRDYLYRFFQAASPPPT